MNGLFHFFHTDTSLENIICKILFESGQKMGRDQSNSNIFILAR